jgi:hypothetical protein
VTTLRRLLDHGWLQVQVALFAIWIVTGAGYDGVVAAFIGLALALLWYRQGCDDGRRLMRWNVAQLTRSANYHLQYGRDARRRQRLAEAKLENAVLALELIQDGRADGEQVCDAWCSGVAMSALASIEELDAERRVAA